MQRSGEKGVALVFTLFLMAALSAMAVSMMFLAQTETSASRNYRTMSQARYAGEAGVHKAINFLLYSYTAPSSMSGYTTTTSPVQYSSADVVLSAVSGVSSNYPDTAVIAAFNTAAQGTLTVGTGTVNYAAYAKLLSMRNVTVYGGAARTIQTWQITATGTVPGSLPATVEVSAILEQNVAPADAYAIFATGTGCGAIDLRGTMHTDSYDSTAPLSGGHPVTDTSGGAVGTNGNLSISGNVTVNGNLDTPRTGVGDCHDGTPTALSAAGSATVSGSVVPLPQAKTYDTPALPSPLPPTSPVTISSCASISALIVPAMCTSSPTGALTITTSGSTPLSLGNVTLGANVYLTIQYGIGGMMASTGTAVVNLNSISLGANSTLNIGTNTGVTMNVVGSGVTSPTPVIDFTGGTFANSSFDPSKFQILYAGTGDIEMTGGSQAAMTIYAPNAAVTMHGTADIYGSILSRSFVDTGGATVHYDRRLATKYFVIGNYVMSSFSWKKY
ncbi:MAG TPA: pilus assembly PilX N-terminal domain-containing protein [Vicinamibacterales bacterium]|nr:pilus assembly PilX N-terminal domain-containing protein [Vicinamibacterales bacterium]